MFVLADTHVFNSSWVNIARFGYMRFDGTSTIASPFTAQSLGQGTPTGPASAGANAPAMSVGGFTIGNAGTPSQWQVTNSFIWQDTVAVNKGRHNLRVGVEVKRHEVDLDSPVETDGLLQISTFADFLLGRVAPRTAARRDRAMSLLQLLEEESSGGMSGTPTSWASHKTISK